MDKIKRRIRKVKNVEDFIKNEDVFDATLRDLEIIGEAARHVLENELVPQEKERYWRKIVDFRNVVAHEYFGIDVDIIFELATKTVFDFEKEVLDLILKFKVKKKFMQILEDEISRLNKMSRILSVEYLDKLAENLNKN
ncbi:MAG: HepT-like ribonuclease domain-containing protein [Candidatus Babeliales bacterium]